MTAPVILFQVVLPLSLLLWLARWPARARIGLIVQALATAVLLFALARVALWLMPPWWTSLLYGLLWLGAVAVAVARHRRRTPPLLPERAPGWFTLATFTVAGSLGAYLVVVAVQAQRLPDAPVVDIAPPLGPGTYSVAHGGSQTLLNAHLKTLDASIDRFRDWRGQSHAVDLVKLDGLGGRGPLGLPRDPRRYESFGEPVRAPCEGSVAARADGLPDMPVPEMDREHMLGNHVILDCGQFAIVLAHLRSGSVRVNVGDSVSRSTWLGEIGNSGNSSEPHLHVHAQRLGPPTRPIAAEPLALTIDGRYFVRNDRFHVAPD